MSVIKYSIVEKAGNEMIVVMQAIENRQKKKIKKNVSYSNWCGETVRKWKISPIIDGRPPNYGQRSADQCASESLIEASMCLPFGVPQLGVHVWCERESHWEKNNHCGTDDVERKKEPHDLRNVLAENQTAVCCRWVSVTCISKRHF